MELRRIVCLVADGFGVGEAPDADGYGDKGANTLGHTVKAVGGLRLENLERLGLGNLPRSHLLKNKTPLAWVGRMAEKSQGKDTTTGHWEIAGLLTTDPFKVYPDGFPRELVEQFVDKAGLAGVLANRAASGTLIIKEWGKEHIKTLKPILYTSADSVFQLAAHEEVFGLDRLYKICEIARGLTLPYKIGRVIARPFLGKYQEEFRRTEHRRDYAISPQLHCLDLLQKGGVPVYSVGKIEDIFAHRSITAGNHTGNNADSLKATLDFLKKSRGQKAFIFTNLVDFDMLYGHRRDPRGYAQALSDFDRILPAILGELTGDDCLIITADHGCDPTFRGTDHTREYVPLIAYRPSHTGGNLGDRATFADIAVTVLDAYGLSTHGLSASGQSFLGSLCQSQPS